MEKQNNTELVDNCDNMYVTFEQAEMLAHILNYSEETDCAYDYIDFQISLILI